MNSYVLGVHKLRADNGNIINCTKFKKNKTTPGESLVIHMGIGCIYFNLIIILIRFLGIDGDECSKMLEKV